MTSLNVYYLAYLLDIWINNIGLSGHQLIEKAVLKNKPKKPHLNDSGGTVFNENFIPI